MNTTAEILAVGTELLLGDIVNTNAQFISRELAKLGINVYRHTVVGDNPARLKAAYARAFEKADVVIATGGLGPTGDDITKEIAAEYFGLPLVFHEESWNAIQARFAGMRAGVPSANRKQALIPEGCTVFPNANGTAPGACIESGDGKALLLLPGPPNEMEPMFLEYAVPFLCTKSSSVFVSRTLKTCGVGESRAEEILKDIIAAQSNPTVAPYAKMSEVWLRVTASAPDGQTARALIAPVAAAIYDRLGENIYGEDDDSLEGIVIKRLRENNLTLAPAESCTGGLLSAALVNVPGASEVFKEGLVTYSNEAKIKSLGVREATLSAHGAVSEQTAAEMAEGAARSAGASVGVSTTGIAGPGGGTPEKPVGLVYVGLYVKDRGVTVKELRLTGDRQRIRHRAVISALDFLRRELFILN
ncbi:MAG: competence/damage-inducible protein A [Clostridiales bacterium]|jgi:nicotinamide-nucleotide amidase|nr:competence/damage-inducible protein A [Clostridiales bacterium]